MKILSITAGAANMYCGSCLRDNALAAELIRQGHDVALVPLYTPTRTDETNVSSERVFFGGVSVFLEQKSALFRKTPRWLDRLWDSSWMLKLVSKSSVKVDPESLGALTVAVLEGKHGPLRKEVDKLVDWLRTEGAPDIISLPYTLLISLAQPLKEALRRPVVCGLQGEDLFLDGLVEPYRSRSMELIRSQVGHVDAFLPASQFYAKKMSDYLGIPMERMHIAPIGINLDGHGIPQEGTAEGPRIGYLARVAPEKGLALLLDALHHLRQQPGMENVAIEAAGYLAPEHKGYLDNCHHKAPKEGFRYRGEVSREEKIRFLKSIDVLSVPCTYDEPKGLFLLEAMANGVPVVQPRLGSFPEIIERTGGGILTGHHPQSIAEGLHKVLTDRELAQRLGRAGHDAVREHYSVERMATRTLEVFRGVAGSH